MATKNVPTPEGQALGKELVRLYEPSIAELEKEGEPDERCATCALRAGTYPNGCVTTLMDLFKCAMEGEVPFMCHDKRRKGEVCHGYFAMRYAHDGKRIATMPWKFSDEYSEQDSEAVDQDASSALGQIHKQGPA
jgi:hypothetical protein